MTFRITGLSPEPFKPLFGLSEDELAALGILRYVADKKPGFPCRVSLLDAEPGETVLLLNYEHQPADTPYRAAHAIFIREAAQHAYDEINQVPQALKSRPLSVRAFDANHMMADADLVDGGRVEALIERFFADSSIAYLQVHYAKRGCYAARVNRV